MAIELADKLYTSTQVADILGVSLRTLYRYMEDNKIKSMRTASGRHRFTKDHIIEFLNAGRSGGEDVAPRQSYESPRNAGYSDVQQNQGQTQGSQNRNYFDNTQAPSNSMPNPYADGSDFSGLNAGVQARNSMQSNDNSFRQQNQQFRKVEETVTEVEDDFEFDVTSFDDDSEDEVVENNSVNSDSDKNFNDPRNDFNENSDRQDEQQQQQQNQQQSQFGAYAQVERQASKPEPRTDFQQSQYTPPATNAAQEEVRPEPVDLSTNLNVRYYKSDYTDLIELAKKIKDTSNAKDLEYAFTLYAGLSLHFLIRPFTILNFYANPEDMQLWKDELRLVPAQKKEDSNVGIIINTDIVFVPTKEIGGFKVVEDKVLLKDLSAVREDEMIKQFRQHLMAV